MSPRGAGRAREMARSLIAAAVALLLASSCAPVEGEGNGSLHLEVDGDRVRIRIEAPPEAQEVALLGGRELLDRPWTGAGAERMAVALDEDGLVPLAAVVDAPGRFGAEVPLTAVLHALGEQGRYLQARWRAAAGDWVLGAAFHGQVTATSSDAPELALLPARSVALRRAAPTWLIAGGCLLLSAGAGIALRRRPRGRVVALVGLASTLACIAALPRAARDLVDLHWRPDPLFLDFAHRAAEHVDALPRGMLVELSGPAHLRCRLAELLPTERLAHAFVAPEARGGVGGARLGPELAPREGERVVERWAEWALLAPSETEASR